jgi:hypothetical protein
MSERWGEEEEVERLVSTERIKAVCQLQAMLLKARLVSLCLQGVQLAQLLGE